MSAKEAFRPLPKKNPAKDMSLYQALGWCYGARIVIEIVDGKAAIASDPHGQQQPWLLEALEAHNERLCYILGMRAKLCWLHERITDLRYRESCFKDLSREQCLERLRQRIKLFAEACDLTNGYSDPTDDIFAPDALTVLTLDYHELTREDNPYPVPAEERRERYASGVIPRECE